MKRPTQVHHSLEDGCAAPKSIHKHFYTQSRVPLIRGRSRRCGSGVDDGRDVVPRVDCGAGVQVPASGTDSSHRVTQASQNVRVVAAKPEEGLSPRDSRCPPV